MDMIYGALVIIVIAAVLLVPYKLSKPVIMKIVYPDKSWFIGRRGNKEIGLISHETKGTHHFTVLSGDEEFKELVGEEMPCR